MGDSLQTGHSWPVFGHDWAVDYLRKGLLHRRVRHAYVIAGVPSVGKTTLAQAFAMALNCEHEDEAARPCGVCRSCKQTRSGNHPDLLFGQPDEKSGRLLIAAIRDVTSRIAMKPYMARYRVAILPDFDRTGGNAQDALLKTLEEPPPHAVLILLVSSLEPLLSTITSRSQIIQLRPVAAETVAQVLTTQHDVAAEAADLLGRLSAGRIGWAIQAAEDPAALDQREMALNLLDDILNMNRAGRFDMAASLANDHRKDKEALPVLLELWLSYWRDALLLAEESPVKPVNIDRRTQLQQLLYTIDGREALAALKATQSMLDTLATNANVRLALEVMFLDYPGLRR
jgi:DNA polymerase-3 subunit delta'